MLIDDRRHGQNLRCGSHPSKEAGATDPQHFPAERPTPRARSVATAATVVPNEVPRGREPADVTDPADDDRGHQRPDPVYVGDGRLRRLDGGDVALADLLAGGVEDADLDQQAQQGVQPADRACPLGGDLMVAAARRADHHLVPQ